MGFKNYIVYLNISDVRPSLRRSNRKIVSRIGGGDGGMWREPI